MSKVIFFVLNADDMGGIERATFSLSDALKNKGYDTKIYSLHKNDNSFFCRDDIIYLNNDKSDFSKLYDYINTSYENDIIISTYDRISIMLIWISILKRKKIKLIASQHADYYAHSSVVRYLRKIAYSRCDAIISLTEKDKCLYNENISNENIFNIGNILKKDDVSINDFSNRNVDIIAVGRLNPIKRFEDVISIANITNYKTEIYGSGDDLNRLLALCNNDKIFQGSTPDIYSKMANSKILLVTSIRESFSMVILEAMAMGCIVVSYNCPTGPSELIKDGFNGFLIKNGDVNAMKNKCIDIIENKIDVNLIQSNAIKFVDNYTPEKIANKWISVLTGVENVN
ncbi:glycosyltransferase [Photobacterium leiognathi]|uniref:glycosyltransferase n=1 Tax=Photobacterium leiognathi TaxID=553611 RepID=UPI002981CD56|nr:glycosyltransferase [Photobacterium leiognathi]